jgi:hypothetical protein
MGGTARASRWVSGRWAKIVEASRFDMDDSCDVDLSSVFVSKMTGYGLPPREDGFFFAFARGFWGE